MIPARVPVRIATLSAQTAVQDRMEIVQVASPMRLLALDPALVIIATIQVEPAVCSVILFVLFVMDQAVLLAQVVLLISIQSPAQTPVSLLVLTTPTITTLMTLSVGSAILSVPRVLERATLFALPAHQASTQFKERQPPV